jgi:Stc1 domain
MAVQLDCSSPTRQFAKNTAKHVQQVRCAHCGKSKPMEAFPANRRKRNGLSSWCRDCHDEARERSLDAKTERRAAELAELRIERLERLRKGIEDDER